MEKKWQYRKLGDVCIVERGGSPRPIDQYITDDENGINWIKIGDTTESMFITETAQKIKSEGMKKSRYVQPGDFLLSNSMSFGRPYILKIDGCIHDGWLVLRDKEELFDKRFLYYYLSSKTTYHKFKGMAVGGVVNNLNSDMVRKVEVPVPSKVEQAEIADLLDKLNSVILMRQQELEKLDDLIKARFVEMFEDKEKAWPVVTIADICKDSRTGPFGSALHHDEFVNEGIFVLGIDNAVENKFSYNRMRYITEDKYQQLKRYTVYPGDVIITIMGTVGRSAVIPKDMPKAINTKHLACLTPNAGVVDSYFLCNAFQIHPDIKQQLRGQTKGAIMDGLNLTIIKGLKFRLPPLELQKQFLEFYNQVDKSKVMNVI
ncbi:restriction endonuclease subunit S [Blautia glucerasea]|uniref:restriction endonuclease subunit S n=1 Tax=Blautia glucerasea TaxID=536633 RepID=UPI00156FF4A6|nr:restriction endonuclease subunit S [Blautia glucerasea]NSJ25963.1 restriction endonuclease subunit M [Blautia glucerasea]